MSNPYFEGVLNEMAVIHRKKSKDYSNGQDYFSNFEYAATAADIPTSRVFEVLIGIKQARLIELLKPGRVPVNESVEDTYKDRAVYCALAYAYHLKIRDLNNELESIEESGCEIGPPQIPSLQPHIGRIETDRSRIQSSGASLRECCNQKDESSLSKQSSSAQESAYDQLHAKEKLRRDR